MSYLEGGFTPRQKTPEIKQLPLHHRNSPYQHFTIPPYGYPLPIEPELAAPSFLPIDPDSKSLAQSVELYNKTSNA